MTSHRLKDRYYWITDWIDTRDPDRKPHRLASRGASLLVLCLLPVLIPARTGRAVWIQQWAKVVTISVLIILIFMRILFEVSDLLYTRSMGK